MSFAQKIQDNKVLALTVGGLLTAGAAAYYFYKNSCPAGKSDSSCCPKTKGGCPKSSGECPVRKSIHDRLGGKVNIDAAVVKFYGKVLKDDRVKHFFKNTNMDHQIKQQQDFLCMAFGGANNYVGKNMVDAHRGMDITNEQYDAIVENLGNTLLEMGVPKELVGEIAAVCEPLRKDITYK